MPTAACQWTCSQEQAVGQGPAGRARRQAGPECGSRQFGPWGTALYSVLALEVGKPLPTRARPHPAGLWESGPRSQRKTLQVQFAVWGLVSMGLP